MYLTSGNQTSFVNTGPGHHFFFLLFYMAEEYRIVKIKNKN